jgi:hypothetical protein
MSPTPAVPRTTTWHPRAETAADPRSLLVPSVVSATPFLSASFDGRALEFDPTGSSTSLGFPVALALLVAGLALLSNVLPGLVIPG